MAEAFPEEPSTSELHEDGSRTTISVLLLASRWQFDTYGLSTINKSLVNNLRLVDPEGESIKITCAVVEEGRINYVDVNDAGKYGVVLKGAKRPMSKNKHSKPELQWLDEHAATYYHHLQDRRYDFIIGHAPYLANGCFNLKDLFREKEIPPKVILMFHGLPKKANGEIDDEILEEWLVEADIVFSIGNSVESELVPYIAGMDDEIRPTHQVYIPSYPLELFNITQESKGTKIGGTQNITMMSAELKDLDITGLDFPLAVNATIGAAEHIREFDGVRTNLTMLAAHEDDRNKWKSANVKILQRKKQHVGLTFKTEVPIDINKLQSYLKRSTLFLLPLKPDSALFGTEALAAIAAGVPVLVSRYSGLASLLRKMAEDEAVVYGTKVESQLDIWKERILERLLRPEESQEAAIRLRKKLLLDTSIAETHLDFINIIAKEACIQLQIDIQSDSDSIIPHEHVETAIKFGVEHTDGTDVNKFVVAFLRKLLLQREKLDKELLKNYLNPAITKLLPEVFSILEDGNRKLANIKSGSLIFKLFCPTQKSRLQLQDENWRIVIQYKMKQLLKLLGAEARVKLQKRESAKMQYTQDPPKGRQLIPRQRAKIADSEKYSLGYETMTTASDLDSELLESGFKVEGWLSQQEESDITKRSGKDQSLQLVKSWTLNHVRASDEFVYVGNSFTVSESGAIGVICTEKPSLSVMYPDTDKAPVILSNDKHYRSVLFVKISDKECLAASSEEDGCLYLWDIESKTSKKVFDPKLPTDKNCKDMAIFKINDSSIGYGEELPLLDGSRRIFILNMDKEEWTLTRSLKFFTPEEIWGMCHTRLADGTSCFLLCAPYDYRIKAVETDGSGTRWEVGKQQMGEKFRPWGICTDESDNVYVADYGQDLIHLLSVTDGAVIKRFDIGSYYGINNIFTVRFHDEHLYMEYLLNPNKYAITKLKRIDQ